MEGSFANNLFIALETELAVPSLDHQNRWKQIALCVSKHINMSHTNDLEVMVFI